MCEMCDIFDSAVECLESLHPTKDMRKAMIALAVDDKVAKTIKEMPDEHIRIQFAIDMMIHWVDKYDANPFEVISNLTKRYGERVEAHLEAEENG